MGLFTPAWNSKNPEKRMNAVAEIKTEKTAGKKDICKLRFFQLILPSYLKKIKPIKTD